MANHIEPRLLKGFRDTLPAAMAARLRMIATIQQTLQLYGFLPLETPVLEYADILQGKLGDEGEKLLYRFADHGNRQVAMRYDFTVPLARVVAQYDDIPKPFKRYQVGPVWRADNTQRGRYREFYQFDFDIVGSDSSLADAELLVVMHDVLKALGLNQFVVKVNDRQFMHQWANQLGLNWEQEKIFLAGLDKMDKIGTDDTLRYWQEHSLGHILTAAALEEMQQALAAHQPLQKTIDQAVQMGLDPDMCRIDSTVVRGLDYYTGIVFETVLPQAPDYGSVLSGGRYDGLVNRFSKQSYPAVGAAVGVDRLYAALTELGIITECMSAATVFVTVFSDQLVQHSLQIAQQLRQSGVATQVAYEATSLGKQLKYAASLGIAYAIIVGPDEASANTFTLRDLTTGHEQSYPLDQLTQEVGQLIVAST